MDSNPGQLNLNRDPSRGDFPWRLMSRPMTSTRTSSTRKMPAMTTFTTTPQDRDATTRRVEQMLRKCELAALSVPETGSVPKDGIGGST